MRRPAHRERPRRSGGVNPLDILRYGQRDIDGLIDRMRPGDWDAIALGTWTAKDLVGHLGAFEVRFVEILDDVPRRGAGDAADRRSARPRSTTTRRPSAATGPSMPSSASSGTPIARRWP